VNLVNRINAFAKLGDILRNPDPEYHRNFSGYISELQLLINNSVNYNPWFTPENVRFAIKAIGLSLKTRQLERWLRNYDQALLEKRKDKTIGVVMAGNIPLVGFHDYLSVMLTGNKLLAKLSTGDNQLLPFLHQLLVKIEPAFAGKVEFTEDTLSGFDAIIATGSDNSARYFDYYFGKYPHIIRKNRNGIAVLTGQETDDDLMAIGEDIFRYFGLGCRSVSKLFVPKNYTFDRFYENIKDYSHVINHHKYANNYEYNKAIYLVNTTPHLDNGFLLLKEDTAFSSPVSVLFYELYSNPKEVKLSLNKQREKIQCIVSVEKTTAEKGVVSPGKSQYPALWDYADGLDTLAFLTEL
jgi:hypothetical protein